MLRSSAFLAALLLAACAGPQAPQDARSPTHPLARLPASFANFPSCAGCLAVMLTLRPDGSYMVRERLGATEFYDFGGWRESAPDAVLHLEGGRDMPRRYGMAVPDVLAAQAGTQGGDLRRLARVERLEGPFRVVGLYDGESFRECHSGVSFPVGASSAGTALRKEYRSRRAPGEPALVSLDARFEQARLREVLVVERTAAILNERGCPG